ncbi:hypothetical protein B0H14DRAFT_3135819 [Mycena olivaceomarginata]|nr:hypothetical protein B0H14DRAFT_3135819 [Mycena olivaceomarginata]
MMQVACRSHIRLLPKTTISERSLAIVLILLQTITNNDNENSLDQVSFDKLYSGMHCAFVDETMDFQTRSVVDPGANAGADTMHNARKIWVKQRHLCAKSYSQGYWSSTVYAMYAYIRGVSRVYLLSTASLLNTIT